MALVYKEQIVIGEEIQQTVRTLAGLTTVEVTAVVLDAGAMTKFFYHLHIVLNAFFYALSLYGIAKLFEVDYLFHKVVLNLTNGNICLLLRCHKQVGRVEAIFFETSQTVECYCIHFFDGIYLVIPESDSQNYLTIGHCYVYCITLNAEVASLQIKVVTDV